MSGRGYIAATPPAECEMCHKVAELRPYGPNGENICYDCGMKDPATTERRFAQHVLGEELDS